jgi:hypothetical protein
MMRRLRSRMQLTCQEQKQSSDRGWKGEQVLMSVEGSGSEGLNPFQRMLRRAGSRRDTPVVVEDYNLAASGRSGMKQTRIDTGSWTQKGKNARESIGKAWSKFFHTAGVPGRQADSPYFVSAVRETQKWGEFSFILCSQKFSFALRLCICSHILCMAAGEGIASPTGRDIDGKYLDMNEKDLKDRYAKFQNDWPIFGVSLMCDSWTARRG